MNLSHGSIRVAPAWAQRTRGATALFAALAGAPAIAGCGVASIGTSGNSDLLSASPDSPSAPKDLAGAASGDLAATSGPDLAATAGHDGGAAPDLAGLGAKADLALSSGPDAQPRGSDAFVPGPIGYLHTHGADVLDDKGRKVRLTGLSWFGLETSNYAPHGLWSRSMASMLDQIQQLGYNSIRVPYCNQLFDNGSTPNGIDLNKNPDLTGLSGIQILDKLVAGAKARGLRIILDRHRPDSGAQSPLWYTGQYSEQRWIDDWVMLARRYLGEATVVGADLHNEPHGTATWGDGNMATDWRLAAERAGNAIQAINPNWLIIVEGVEVVGLDSYWWGGNLRAAGANPVRLGSANQLVYSAHDYPASVFNQTWFSDMQYPKNLPAVWDANWGYLARTGVAPVWVGEFGTKNQSLSDQQWLTAMAAYVANNSLGFAYWCWNPDSGDTGGILQDDWQSVNADKQAVLRPLLAPLIQ